MCLAVLKWLPHKHQSQFLILLSFPLETDSLSLRRNLLKINITSVHNVHWHTEYNDRVKVTGAKALTNKLKARGLMCKPASSSTTHTMTKYSKSWAMGLMGLNRETHKLAELTLMQLKLLLNFKCIRLWWLFWSILKGTGQLGREIPLQ